MGLTEPFGVGREVSRARPPQFGGLEQPFHFARGPRRDITAVSATFYRLEPRPVLLGDEQSPIARERHPLGFVRDAVGHDEVRDRFAADGQNRRRGGNGGGFALEKNPRQHGFRMPEGLQVSGGFAQRILDEAQSPQRLLLLERHDQVIDPVEQQCPCFRQHPLLQATAKTVLLSERLEAVENEILRVVAQRPIEPAFLRDGWGSVHGAPGWWFGVIRQK